MSENLDPTNLGWVIQGGRHVPVMIDNGTAPAILLNMIYCNRSVGWKTLRCICKKHELDCIAVCGPCQDGNCENINHRSILL